MTFKTKAEAQQRAERLEKWADEWDLVSTDPYADKGSKRVADAVTESHRAEAARIRALLPNLPE